MAPIDADESRCIIAENVRISHIQRRPRSD